ncbi:MAG: restriction endonuclease subunit S [Treponema sp.]|nr:restriction endonuclease subunit S [Treponema sp.]
MNEWKTVRLGDVCEIARGGSPRPINEYITTDENGINWIKIGDTSSDSKYIERTEQKIKPEGMKKSRYVHSGDFILSNSMSFGRPYILKIDGCIHDGWLVLQNIQNDIDKDYLYFVLSSPSAYHQFERMAVGGVVNNLNSDKVKELIFPLPPLEKQKQIAKILDKCNILIIKHKQMVEKYDALIKSRFIEMFGDPIENTKSWIEEPLGNCCLLKAGKAIKASELADKDKEHPYPCFGGNGIRGFIGKKSHTGKIVLIGRQGALCGNVQLTDGDFYATEHAVVTSPEKELNSIWLYHLLFLMDLNRYKSGAAQPGLTVEKLNTVPTMIVPIELQNDFAAFVQQIDKSKFAVQKSLEKAETLYKSLMQEYFG